MKKILAITLLSLVSAGLYADIYLSPEAAYLSEEDPAAYYSIFLMVYDEAKTDDQMTREVNIIVGAMTNILLNARMRTPELLQYIDAFRIYWDEPIPVGLMVYQVPVDWIGLEMELHSLGKL